MRTGTENLTERLFKSIITWSVLSETPHPPQKKQNITKQNKNKSKKKKKTENPLIPAKRLS